MKFRGSGIREGGFLSRRRSPVQLRSAPPVFPEGKNGSGTHILKILRVFAQNLFLCVTDQKPQNPPESIFRPYFTSVKQGFFFILVS